jgi:hypothetical protein
MDIILKDIERLFVNKTSELNIQSEKFFTDEQYQQVRLQNCSKYKLYKKLIDLIIDKNLLFMIFEYHTPVETKVLELNDFIRFDEFTARESCFELRKSSEGGSKIFLNYNGTFSQFDPSGCRFDVPSPFDLRNRMYATYSLKTVYMLQNKTGSYVKFVKRDHKILKNLYLRDTVKILNIYSVSCGTENINFGQNWDKIPKAISSCVSDSESLPYIKININQYTGYKNSELQTCNSESDLCVDYQVYTIEYADATCPELLQTLPDLDNHKIFSETLRSMLNSDLHQKNIDILTKHCVLFSLNYSSKKGLEYYRRPLTHAEATYGPVPQGHFIVKPAINIHKIVPVVYKQELHGVFILASCDDYFKNQQSTDPNSFRLPLSIEQKSRTRKWLYFKIDPKKYSEAYSKVVATENVLIHPEKAREIFSEIYESRTNFSSIEEVFDQHFIIDWIRAKKCRKLLTYTGDIVKKKKYNYAGDTYLYDAEIVNPIDISSDASGKIAMLTSTSIYILDHELTVIKTTKEKCCKPFKRLVRHYTNRISIESLISIPPIYQSPFKKIKKHRTNKGKNLIKAPKFLDISHLRLSSFLFETFINFEAKDRISFISSDILALYSRNCIYRVHL